jgi:hypothetical protein
MRNRSGTRILFVLGFIAASLAYGGWTLQQTVPNPDATTAVARRVIATPTVQDNLAKQLQTQVDRELASAHADAQVQRAVDAAMRDPRVVNAFANAVGDVQRALLSGSPRAISINSRALTSAVHDALVRTDPQLAAQLAQQPPVSATIDANQAPNLRNIADFADVAVALGTVVALVLIGIALAADRSRSAIARLGRRIAYLSIAPIVAFGVLPAVIGSHGVADVVRVALQEYAARVLPSAFAFLAAGVVIAIGSLFMRRSSGAPATGNDAFAFTPAPALPPPSDPLAPALAPRLGESLQL